MAITFSCAHCGKSLTTTEDKAGRKAKCPGCGEVLTVPDTASDFDAGDEPGTMGDEDLAELPAPRSRAGGAMQVCPMCGAKNSRRAKTCEECGEKLPTSLDDDARFGNLEYAGFWLRFVAWFLDSILLGCFSGLIGAVIGFVLALVLIAGNNGNPNIVRDEGMQALFNVVGYAIGIGIGWMYFAFMESSTTQATLGKMAVGLKVCDLDGRRITFGRATGRFFGKIISGFTCLIGYIMAAFTERKQALHDMIAGTLVVRK